MSVWIRINFNKCSAFFSNVCMPVPSRLLTTTSLLSAEQGCHMSLESLQKEF